MKKVKCASEWYTKEEQEWIDKMIEEALEDAKNPDSWITFEEFKKETEESIRKTKERIKNGKNRNYSNKQSKDRYKQYRELY